MAVARTYTRRTPEAARAVILDAAAAVFAELLPDRAGMRDIAQRAGVSHGLITHYFKTYENLIDEVIERRLAAMRTAAFARLGTATFAAGEDTPLLDVLMDLLADPTLTRLVAWSLLAGRGARVVGAGQLGRIVDAMHARLRALGADLPRARLEMSVLLAIAAVAGWATAGTALERAAGRGPIERDELKRELGRMIRAYVQAP